ncbi:hypothetical protein BRC81_07840 [Halobacteriales archaeon QS_1_68_20]|nr:MAG: hypothetical protein BRC81_07840 [Halobacteriales archaeon QS_1_68_20]
MSRTDRTASQRTDPEIHEPMTDDTCPICGQPVHEAERVGVVTYTLQACGHRVDDRALADLSIGDETTDKNRENRVS